MATAQDGERAMTRSVLFSIGMIAQPARSCFTASSASSKLKHGSGRHSGAHSIAARCELAPGAPWNATARAG